MIKAIVFDLDGMIYLTKEMFSTRISRDLDIPLEDVLDFFKKHFGKCKRGRKDLKEELEKYISRWGWKKGLDALLEYWFKDGKLDREMIDLISELKQKGIVCVLCTDNEKYRVEYLKRNHGIDRIFDIIVASCETGYMKPERGIFDEILETTGLPADQIIFCDEKEKNVKVAEEFGFIPLLYKGLEDFRKKLAVAGIKLNGK